MALHIFVGPTLPPAQALELAPGSVIHSPVSHGDLMRLQASAGDVVIIIDGLYHHAASVRHKEILALLSKEVQVIGCASMGALRAVELQPYGMIGLGVVFAMYHSGLIDADDEVAVAHAAEPPFKQFSDALINFRYALQKAVQADVIDRECERDVISIAKSLHYTERRWRAVAAIIRRSQPDLLQPFSRLRAFLEDNPAYGDAKKSDAISVLSRVGDLTLRTVRPHEADVHNYWRSKHLCDWEIQYSSSSCDAAVVSNTDMLHYHQLYSSAFPRRWRQLALGDLCTSQDQSYRVSCDKCLSTAATAAAANWGITSSQLAPRQIRCWTTRDERSRLTEQDLILLALTRSYRPPSLLNKLASSMPELLADETVRDAVAQSYQINHEIDSWNVARSTDHIKHAKLIKHLSSTWGLSGYGPEHLQAAARDRAFHTIDEAANAARPFFLRHFFLQKVNSQNVSLINPINEMAVRIIVHPQLASIFSSTQQSTKLYLDGTHRVRRPEDTWHIIDARLMQFGITRVADVTGLDCIGIPVFMAVRPLGRTLSVSQGKGGSHLLAKISAAMEAIELWHVEYLRPDVRYRRLTPQQLRLPYNIADVTDPEGLVTGETPLDWLEGSGLLTGSTIPVPVNLIHYLEWPNLEWLPPGLRWNTSGLASGNSRAEACLHAIYEIIERDAGSSEPESAWSSVDPPTIDDEYVTELVTKLLHASVRLAIYHLPSRFGIPCFCAKIWSSDFPVICLGWGAHINPSVALARSITEAAQSRLTAIAGSRDDLPSIYGLLRAGGTPPPSIRSSHISWQNCANLFSDAFSDARVELSWLCGRIQRVVGTEPIMVDLTFDELLPVLKVIIPGARLDLNRIHPKR